MAEQFANNAATTLNGAINNTVTSIVVSDGSVFPSSGNFRVVSGTEIMLVTARSTNTLTVVRGQEGTTATSHANGDSISLVYTKGSLEQFIADLDQSGGYSSRPSSPYKGTVYTATDMHARWWYDGTNWNQIWPVYVPNARRFISGNWTAVNTSTESRTDRNGILTFSNMPINNNAIRGYTKSMPSTPYKCTWILGKNPWVASSASFYIGHRESSSGKLKVLYNSANAIGVEQWNNYNSFNASVSTGRLAFGARVRYLRVENDGTNFKYYNSHDGKNFTLHYSEANTLFWTSAADQIFFGGFVSVAYDGSASGAPLTLYGYWEE